MIVVDASALVARLTDQGPAGSWVDDLIADADRVAAPHHCLFETANILRRMEARGAVGSLQAAEAHTELLDLPIELYPFHGLAEPAWDLRHNLTTYDGSYVALAQLLKCPLVTADLRLARGSRRVGVELFTPDERPGLG